MYLLMGLIFIGLSIVFISSIGFFAIVPIFIMLCIMAYMTDFLSNKEKKQKLRYQAYQELKEQFKERDNIPF